MYRVGVVTKSGKVLSSNFDTKEDAETWILEKDEELGLKKAIIQNKETKERENIL